MKNATLHNTKLYVQHMLAITAVAMAIPLSVHAASKTEREPKADQPVREQHCFEHEMGPSMKMFERLNLSAEQKTRIQTLLQARQGETKNIREEHHQLRKELDEIVANPAFDQAKAERLLRKTQDQEFSMHLAMLKTRHDIYQILTPEQQQKAKVMKETFEMRREKRHLHPAGQPPMDQPPKN